MSYELIIGPMKSGKSLELIARTAPYEYSDKKTVYIQPHRNTRDEGIRSRLGLNVEARKVSSLKEVNDDFDVIAIDEIHMFPATDSTYISNWLKQPKAVFISGLDLDYRGQLMPIIKNLLELKPETIINKLAVCDICRQYRASFTQILHNGKPILKGLPAVVPEDGSYEYEARCRNCFKQG